MPSKIEPNARPWTVKEQVLKDLPTGLTFRFHIGADGNPILSVFGDCLRYGNRDICFGSDGEQSGGGTCLTPCPVPS